MFAIEARQMGYRVHTFSPDNDTPAGHIADVEVCASYEDEKAVRDFASRIDVLTFEFENIPVQTIEWCAEHCEVRPAGSVLHIAQHRLREKQFLFGAGLPLPRFREISSLVSLQSAVKELGFPCVLKTAAFGYDGKGQRKIKEGDDLAKLWREFDSTLAVLEEWVPFTDELSVLVARGINGEMRTFPVPHNTHANHILDVSRVPYGKPVLENAAARLACTVAEKIGVVGLLAVEMFLLADDSLLVNEIAPRPHNSGHYSFGGCVTSQFEQQLRAVCGLPLGSTELLRPCAMANLLGDVWANGEPDWTAALSIPGVELHLYGKTDPRPGRKMGHLLAFGTTTEEAAKKVIEARAALKGEWSETRLGSIADAVAWLRRGEPVAIPTETVYGLAADALRPEAVAKVFEAKERPFFDPLIVHVADEAMLEKVAVVPAEGPVRELMRAFWPGPLTLILPRQNAVPDLVTSGLETVAVRMPSHPVLKEVLQAFGGPLAAPSANRFGRISPTRAAHVLSELGGRIPLVVDGGPTVHGVESTIVEVAGNVLKILRNGPVTPEELARFGEVQHGPEAGLLPSAPGQLKSHYAPRTPLVLVDQAADFVPKANTRAGLLAWRPLKKTAGSFTIVEVLSERGDLREAAAGIFAAMRKLDEAELDVIVAERVPAEGIGHAILDRLTKAAAGS